MVGNVVEVAEVDLWGRPIGAVSWDERRGCASFEYQERFVHSGIEPAPLMMPTGSRDIFSFPELSVQSFIGLPGLLADSLPDDFGNRLIHEWLIRQGRDPESFSPVDRLCYIGQRGMGAIEYRPSIRPASGRSATVEIGDLVDLVRAVLHQREELQVHLSGNDSVDGRALDDIFRVGTSAGGARAKAIVAWNPRTNEMRSGQVKAPDGFEYWLLKFDGVDNRYEGLADAQGYGKIEYAYYLMAKAAGIEMEPSRLLHENGRSHFMTRRFDRTNSGEKIHMQSLFAMSHLDFKLPGAHGYEQALAVIQQLNMPMSTMAEQYRRMVFNVLARNQDDHTRNIAFLMDRTGEWRLSPAFDVTYAYNPAGAWTGQHQMLINGKQENFILDDLSAVANRFNISHAKSIFDQVEEAVGSWLNDAQQAGVDETTAKRIAKSHRLNLKSR